MKQVVALPALVAMLAIASSAMAEEPMKGPADRAAHFKEKLAGMPEDKQQLVLDTFKSGREERKDSWEAMKTKRDELRALSLAPTFDKKAYLAKSAEIRTMKDEMSVRRSERMAELLSKLNANERKILADAKPEHRGMHGKQREHDEPDAE